MHQEQAKRLAKIHELNGIRRRWRMSQPRVCYYCGVSLRKSKPGEWTRKVPQATVDHKQPLSRGGKDEPDNWAVCCQPCNTRKGRMTEEEFRKVKEAPDGK